MWIKLLAILGYLKPSFLKKQWQNLIEKTWFELIYGFFKIIFKTIYLSVWSIYYVNKVITKVILELMLGKYGYVEEEEEPMEKQPTISYASMVEGPRMALMSAEDVLSKQTDEGIVEDISMIVFN